MKKLIGMGLIAVLVSVVACQSVPSARPGPGLTVSNGGFLKEGRPYRGVGANYFDLFLRILQKPETTSSLEGLEKLSAAGIPFVRFSACGFSAKDWQLYFDDKPEYFRRMDRVVQTAEKARIGLIPSMFWTLVVSDIANEPRDQWGNPGSKTIALMRQYTADVVTRYKDSPAIWAWEFGNEVNLAADLPNAAQFRKKGGTERDDLKSDHMVVMFTEFAREVRRHDPNRALISGNSHPRASSWHNTRERSWKPDNQEQQREILLRDNPAPLDTLAIHFYGDHPVEKDVAVWAKDRSEYLRWLKSLGRETGRPLFIGEFGLGIQKEKTEAETRAVYEELIVAMEQARVDLAAFWVFDLPSQDKSWNVTFDNDRSYMLKLAVEANKRWKEAACR